MEAVLATEFMEEPQSNLKQKDNPRSVKDDSTSRKVSFKFASVVPLTVIINTSREVFALVNSYANSIKVP